MEAAVGGPWLDVEHGAPAVPSQKRGEAVPPTSNRQQREVEPFAPDTRPGADEYVYCKGCGTQLESRSRLAKPRAVVEFMMCEPCREKYGHSLMPTPGSPTYCYRCGTLEEVFIAPGVSPATYHVCPRCLPDRAPRYRAGDFEPPMKQPEEEGETAKA